MKRLLIAAQLLLLAACGGSGPESAEAPAESAANPLEIYWIDVEGGAATLIVSPSGGTALMDAGWPGFDNRDPKRVAHVLKDVVGASKLDYFITSHFHVDHVGGLPGLAELVEIGTFVDHGDSVEKDWDNERAQKLWADYERVAAGKRMHIKPGDKLPLPGVDLTFVAAASQFIDQPLTPSEPNPLCEGAERKELDEGENGKSVGFVVRVGDFEFLDLGDLSWNFELETACPQNLFGKIDLYQVTHHGMALSGAPPHIQAIQPLVAVINNGHLKGGQAATYQALTGTQSLQDLWQVHKALHTPDAPNAPEDLIANLEEADVCQGNWIKASVQADGSFTITNSRNGFSKSYQPRP
jgi:beta-lactamase superfamily II metal-dependent hydrolase